MTDEVKPRGGLKYPRADEGVPIQKIEIMRGKVVVKTENGQTMIIPASRPLK